MAVRQEELDTWLESLAEQVFELAGSEVPQYVGLAFMQEGMRHAESNEAVQYVGSACAMGYFSRVAELHALAIDEVNADLADFLEWAAEENNFGDDWFATMNGAANTVANASESTAPASVETAALLAPEGMGTEARMRLAGHLLLQVFESDGRPRFGVESAAMMRAWRVGYYLRACEAALPDQAVRQLGAA
jgi:hypothetical protein